MKKESICEICNSQFVPTAGSKGLYCSYTCSAKGVGLKNKHRQESIRIEKLTNNPTFCLQCSNLLISNHRNLFCSRSCSATYTNARKEYKKPNNSTCLSCNSVTSRKNAKYCSSKCAAIPKKQNKEYHSKINAARQSLYRAKNLRKIHPTANKEKIRKFYLNCPIGYEVDHITPLSLGGLHHEDNLQYLTVLENRKKGNRWIG